MDMNVKDPGTETALASEQGYDRSPTIYLSDAQCEALGITKLPKPGDKIELKVVATVVRASLSVEEPREKEEAGEKAGPDMDVTLRLGDIEITKAPGKSAASALYG
jgi:hypothetical protein